MKLSEIQDLIKFVAKSGVSEVELETKDVKIIIKTPTNGKRLSTENAVVVPTVPSASVNVVAPTFPGIPQVTILPATETKAPDAGKESGVDESKYVIIKSPMIGTFYRSPSPDKPVFVNVGDEIKPGKPIAIIEAMKLFNEIESDISGVIVKILVNDSTPVEYDQALFLVDPS